VSPVIEHQIVELIKARARKTAKTDPSTGELVLVYTWPVRLVGFLGSVLSVAGGLMMVMEGVPVRAGHALFVILWALIAVSQFWLLIVSMTTRVRIGDRGFVGQSAWYLSKEIAWDDIVEVRYRRFGDDFLVLDGQGTTIKIPLFMEGLGSFVQRVRSRLPATVYHKATPGFVKVRQAWDET
jgi:hypothetical protein